MSVSRPRPLLGLACSVLALLLAPGSPGAASKVIGGTEPGVRILRGTATASAPANAARGDSISALLAPPPAAADSAARAWTLRLVAAYGGPAALLDWVERGERRGLQVTQSPVRMDARVRERRAGSRLRIDARVAGVEFTMVSTAEEQWQALYGIVSDLPEQEREAIASARAHDEGLLLAALKGTFPARLDPATADSDTIGLLVWGSRGSATRFRATRADGRLHAIEFVDRDPEAAGDVFQVVRFADWRPVGPGLAPLVARHEGHVPLRMIELVDGVPSGESVIDTLDLAQEVPAELFLRPDAPRAGTGAPRRSIIALERHGDHHFADVRFADGIARRFLVDSGAAVTAVSRELAAILKLATGEKLDVAGVGGGAAAEAALLPPFDLGSHRLTGVRGIVLDLGGLSEALSTRIDGVLGVSSFARFAVTWDFERGVLEIAESRDPQASSPRGTRVPFTMAGGLVFVPVRVDGGAATDFVADTGAWRTFLSATLAGTVANPPEQRLPGIPYSGVDGRRVETEALRLRSLEIGGLTVPRPIVLAPSALDGGERRARRADPRSRRARARHPATLPADARLSAAGTAARAGARRRPRPRRSRSTLSAARESRCRPARTGRARASRACSRGSPAARGRPGGRRSRARDRRPERGPGVGRAIVRAAGRPGGHAGVAARAARRTGESARSSSCARS